MRLSHELSETQPKPSQENAEIGEHTRRLYDRLSWKEAGVLAQLMTGMARLNGYLHRINAAGSDRCACGQVREKWTTSSSSSNAQNGRLGRQIPLPATTQTGYGQISAVPTHYATNSIIG